MKNSFTLLVAALACTVPQLAAAVPIHATFNGTVSGSGGFTNVLGDFPVGTAASFNVTFDDARLVDSAEDVTGYDVGPVSGWLRLGTLEWLFDAGSIWTYSFLNGPGHPVVSYGLQLTGTGPTISDSGSIFGLFLQLTPDATALRRGYTARRLRLSGSERHVLQLRRSLRNFQNFERDLRTSAGHRVAPAQCCRAAGNLAQVAQRRAGCCGLLTSHEMFTSC